MMTRLFLRRLGLWLSIGVVVVGMALFVIDWQANRLLRRAVPPNGFARGLGVQAQRTHLSLWKRKAVFEDLRLADSSGTNAMVRVRRLVVTFPFSTLWHPSHPRFQEIQFEKAVLMLTRDEAGRWNFETLVEPAAIEQAPETIPPAPTEQPVPSPALERPSRPLPTLAVGRISGPLLIRVRGPESLDRSREVRLRFDLEGRDLTTAASDAPESEWGLLSGRGRIEWQNAETPLSWTLRVGPGLSVGKRSFDLDAETGELPKAWADSWLGSVLNVTGRVERITATAALRVRDGQFNTTQSVINVRLNGVRLGMRTVPAVTLKIPVEGTLENPTWRLESALTVLGAQLLGEEIRALSGRSGQE